MDPYHSTNQPGKSSADQTEESMKEKVAKGVGAVAGAVKGFTEEMKKQHMGEKTKQAIQETGKTTREVAGTARKEMDETKKTMKGSEGSSGSGSSGKS